MVEIRRGTYLNCRELRYLVRNVDTIHTKRKFLEINLYIKSN